MRIENFSLEPTDQPSKLDRLAAGMKNELPSSDACDRPFSLTQENRHELAPVSAETREKMTEAGFPGRVQDAIESDAEANIYLDAPLKAGEVNGKGALVRDDINYGQKDVFGNTNLERMQQGLAPLDGDEKPVELHHIGQKPDSPLAELTRDEHRGRGNDNVLHNKLKESEIDRGDFGAERSEYWKARAAQVETQI